MPSLMHSGYKGRECREQTDCGWDGGGGAANFELEGWSHTVDVLPPTERSSRPGEQVNNLVSALWSEVEVAFSQSWKEEAHQGSFLEKRLEKMWTHILS